MEIKKLIKRSDFMRLKDHGEGVKKPAFVVVVEKNDSGVVRFGVTASKRVGNAVVRGRAKRRMRAVFDEVVRLNPDFSCAGMDMNMIARNYVLDRHFDRMVKELKDAIEQLK